MEITRKTAEYVAALSRLRLTEEELGNVTRDLSAILNYMDEIGAVPEENMLLSERLSNVTRPDTVCPSMDREALLANAPVHSEETVIVPRTLEDAGV